MAGPPGAAAAAAVGIDSRRPGYSPRTHAMTPISSNSAARDRPKRHVAFRPAAGSIPGTREPGRRAGLARRGDIACVALALLPARSGCGGVASVGSTLYSTSEAIATVVKDAIGGSNADEQEVEPDRPE